MLSDFKAFVLRGNVVDLAVGVVIGAAFGNVVDSLVTDVFTPLLAIPGETNFDSLVIEIGGGVIAYGAFINAIISFLTIAAAVFFFIVRPLGRMASRRSGEPVPTTRPCPFCLTEIPRAARVCSACTREVT
ncbi:MAG: large conductance mechanosensitive channel protein MscL [Acidimicrobiales bacterium]